MRNAARAGCFLARVLRTAVALALLASLLAPASHAGASQEVSSGSQAPASISGTVLDPTGRALPDVPVSFVSSSSGQKLESRTDQAGRFSLAAVPPGEYQVQVSRPGFSQNAGRMSISAGQRVRRDIVPQIGGILHRYDVAPKHTDPESAGPKRIVLGKPAPPDPCGPASPPGCLTPPMRLVEAWPVFPSALAAKGLSEQVEIQGRLGTDGFLKDLRANNGATPELAAAAIEALRLWEYSLLRLNGIPQECPVTVTLRFNGGTN